MERRTTAEEIMAHNHIHIDPALPLVRQADKGHNRWHPDLAPAVRIASGSSVEMETLDGLDGQMREVKRIHDQMSGHVVWGLPLFPDEVRGRERLEAFWEGAAELPDMARVLRRQASAPPQVDTPPPLPSSEIALLIFAGKGGVGKTTLARELGISLAS